MELYLCNTQLDHPIKAALDVMQVQYALHNVDDRSIHDQLLARTGSTDVPTVIFDDGTYLIQPTPEQFTSKMEALLAGNQPTEQSGIDWQKWRTIAAIIILGLLTFIAGFILGEALSPTVASLLGVFLLVGIVGVLLISLIPPIKRLMMRLDKQQFFKAIRWIGLFAYLAIMGVSLSAQHQPFAIWLWSGLAGATIALTIVLAACSRKWWSKWLPQFRKAQTILAFAGLIGFIGLLVFSVLTQQPSISAGVLAIQLILLGTMFIVGGPLLVGAKSGQQTPEQVVGILFPAIGLLVVIGLLSAMIK